MSELDLCIDSCIVNPYHNSQSEMCYDQQRIIAKEPPDKNKNMGPSYSEFLIAKLAKEKKGTFGFLVGCEQEEFKAELPAFDNPDIDLVTVTLGGERTTSPNYCSDISADGNVIAFSSDENELVDGDTNGEKDIFIFDKLKKEFERISVSSNGSEANNWSSASMISGNGRFVAFNSLASNLVLNDNNDKADIFVHDRQAKKTERVSVSSKGEEANGDSHAPSISADGRYVTFNSSATNLVPYGKEGIDDVFVYDRQTKKISKASATFEGLDPNGSSGIPAISGNGQFVAFGSWADNLISKDTNNVYDLFLRDLVNDSINRISVPYAAGSGQSDHNSSRPDINADGRFIAFHSGASNLVKGDDNDNWDTFVYDTEGAKATSCTIDGGGNAMYPSISDDGKFVAFASASALTPDDTNDRVTDVYVCDLENDKIARVSRSKDGSDGTADGCSDAAISGDGRFIAFDAWSVSYDTTKKTYVERAERSDIFLAKNPLFKEKE